ncbi:MAG: cation transporter, partial [Ruminococcus sp.]|nr:cation transporter [Ruminococcus sp.]
RPLRFNNNTRKNRKEDSVLIMINDREKTIVRTSIVGIAVNVVLVLFKMAVGLIANSIAIILDAVNNLSDALSSVITIIGTKLSGRRPDKKHPYGYGRIEYLTSVIISVIVLIAGITSIRESAVKIFAPEETNYSIYSIIIISVAIVTKFLVGRYVKGVGTRIHSQSLIASGSDAFFDAILSFGTLVGAVASLLWGLNLEGYLGVLISVIIIKAGTEMLLETLGSIIGTRADSDLTKRLRERINFYSGVNGTYDLTLHNYGPSKIIASAHIEVDDTMTAKEIHTLCRRIQTDVFGEYGIVLTLGIYASNTSDEFAEYRKIAEEAVKKQKDVLQMHGFYIDEKVKSISFDIIVDFKADAEKICEEIVTEVSGRIPDYRIDVILDSDYSD